ncbi:MAG: glycosyltransferase family 2 protein [Candidatus Ozemobacteraceae bacterium]
MSEPFFTIVIANYNYGRFIDEAIQSVLKQSCQDFELLVVDGDSNDNSVEVIKKYENHIAWWCSEKDRGQSHAINKGFAKARGKFLTWLNADDLLLPRTLENAKAKLLQNPESRWLTGNFFRFLIDGTIVECKWGPHFLPPFLQHPSAPIVVFGPTSFFARSLIEEFGGLDEDVCAHHSMDTDLWLRFMANNVLQIRLNHYCWGFRMHEKSKTAEFSGHKVCEQQRDYYKKTGDKVFEKNAYTPSKIIRVAQLIWRVLDGSLAVMLFINIFLKKEKFNRYFG